MTPDGSDDDDDDDDDDGGRRRDEEFVDGDAPARQMPSADTGVPIRPLNAPHQSRSLSPELLFGVAAAAVAAAAAAAAASWPFEKKKKR